MVNGHRKNRTVDPCSLIRQTNIRDRVKEMADLSIQDGMERGVTVFMRDGSLFIGETHRGDSHSIIIPSPTTKWFGLLRNGEDIGVIHTHPNEPFDSLFSLKDIKTFTNSDLLFSAAAFDEGEDGDILVDVFTNTRFDSFDELKEHIGKGEKRMEFIKKANETLLGCTLNLEKNNG